MAVLPEFLAEFLDSPYVVQGVCATLLMVVIASVWGDILDGIPHRRIPLVGRTWWEITNKKARLRFTQSCRDLIIEGFAKVCTQAIGVFLQALIEPGKPCIPNHWSYTTDDCAAPEVHQRN